MNNDEIKIESVKDARDLFSIAVVLNGLMDKFELVDATVSSHDQEIATLIRSVDALNESVKSLITEVSALKDKTEVVNYNSKLRADNVSLNKKVKELTKQLEGKGGPKSETKTEQTKAEVKEEKKIDTNTVSTKILAEARKHIASCQGKTKKLFRFNEMKGQYKEQGFAKAIYEYLQDVGFIDNAGKILDKSIKI